MNLQTKNGPVVYFIQAGEDGPIKIGCTRNFPARLSALRTSSPYPLRVLGTMPNRRHAAKEAELHMRFVAHRLHGEWFSPAPELLTYIKRAVGMSARVRAAPTLPPKTETLGALRAECEDMVRAVRRSFRTHIPHGRKFPRGWQRVLPMSLWHTVSDEP